jgi:hypothetical protein
MVQRFEDWCREWKGPPYASLQECVREQHDSAVNLYGEIIADSIAPPPNVLSYAGIEWLVAVVSWPGNRVLLALAASSPDAIYQFGIERSVFEGGIPLALSVLLYLAAAVVAHIVWKIWRM